MENNLGSIPLPLFKMEDLKVLLFMLTISGNIYPKIN